jgi:two-component system CheB/CheR fusion protein
MNEYIGEGILLLISDVTSLVDERQRIENENTQVQGAMGRLQAQYDQISALNEDLLRANEELATTNTHLRATNEEFLVGNEELQAASEEVETLNEELQATNEELETLNEELQATVEELKTTTDDLQARSVEPADLAAERESQRIASEQEREHLTAILDQIGYAVASFDRDGRLVTANTAYHRLFGALPAPVLEDEDGSALAASSHPDQRMKTVPFAMCFTIREGDKRRRYEATGQELDGDTRHNRLLLVREINA